METIGSQSIADVLIRRDGLTREEADEMVDEARAEMTRRMESGEGAYDICEEFFGLEPDYLDELM